MKSAVRLAGALLLSCAGASLAQSPLGSPPDAKGPNINIFYRADMKLASVPLVKVTADCYTVNYGGNLMWFPKSAYSYRTEYDGNPAALDYNARRMETPCGVAPPPIPPVAKPTAPTSVCLSAKPAPTTALVTYGGQIRPGTHKIEEISPKCISFEYGGTPMFTTPDEAGGVTCVNNTVQIDYDTANRTNQKLHPYRFRYPEACK